jgi:DNA repair protein RadC
MKRKKKQKPLRGAAEVKPPAPCGPGTALDEPAVEAISIPLWKRVGRFYPYGGTARSIVKEFQELEGLDQEVMAVAGLDHDNRILGRWVVALGRGNRVSVHPRDVFRPAMNAGAVTIVLIHNHQCRGPRPSRLDDDLTERIAEAGRILGVELADHIVVGDKGTLYYSYVERNRCGFGASETASYRKAEGIAELARARSWASHSGTELKPPFPVGERRSRRRRKANAVRVEVEAP